MRKMALFSGLAFASVMSGLPARAIAAADSTAVATPRVESFIERRFRGVVRQKYDFSCGSAALATLLRFHYGRAIDEEAVFRGMWRNGDRAQIRRVGFSLLDMKTYLQAHGLAADGFKVDLDKIRQVGLPGIALITVNRYRHFVVVKGVNAGQVLIGDPALGMRMVPRAEFIRVWNGAYFIINHEQSTGKASFNRRLQWAALPGAPLSDGFTEPLSQQALSLTAPFYTDF
jgi:predicted double-glycine peptidase